MNDVNFNSNFNCLENFVVLSDVRDLSRFLGECFVRIQMEIFLEFQKFHKEMLENFVFNFKTSSLR